MIKQCYQCRYFLGYTKNDIKNPQVLCAKKDKLTLVNDCDSVICMDFQVADKKNLCPYDIIDALTYNLNGVHACWVGNAIKHLYNYNQTQVTSELEAVIEILNEYVNVIRGKQCEKTN